MKHIFVLAMLCPLLCLGQPTKITPLTIGDTLPDMALSNIINYKTPSAKLSSFKGELLILDFWATWCTSCLKHFPQMDSLQQQYAGQVQALLVNSTNTGDDEEKVASFFEKRKRPDGSRYSLPSLVNDTLLSALFPHRSVPHYVWLNASRQVVAITLPEELTSQNIQACLKGSPLNLPLKKDIMDYNPALPLFEGGNAGDGAALLFRSTLTGYIGGMGGGLKKWNNGTHQKLTWFNKPILSLYHIALGFTGNRVLLEVTDGARYIQYNQPHAQWKNNLYSYEITTPLHAPDSLLRAFMLQDLNRYLSLNGRMEKRTVSCWVLIQTGPATRLLSKGGVPGARWFSKEHPCTRLQNKPLSQLVEALNAQILSRPLRPIVLDETGITGNIDIELAAPLDDLPALKKELRHYGLDLLPALRELEVFVLTENNSKEQPESTTTTPAGNQTKLRQQAIEKGRKENAQTSKRPSTKPETINNKP